MGLLQKCGSPVFLEKNYLINYSIIPDEFQYPVYSVLKARKALQEPFALAGPYFSKVCLRYFDSLEHFTAIP